MFPMITFALSYVNLQILQGLFDKPAVKQFFHPVPFFDSVSRIGVNLALHNKFLKFGVCLRAGIGGFLNTCFR